MISCKIIIHSHYLVIPVHRRQLDSFQVNSEKCTALNSLVSYVDLSFAAALAFPVLMFMRKVVVKSRYINGWWSFTGTTFWMNKRVQWISFTDLIDLITHVCIVRSIFTVSSSFNCCRPLCLYGSICSGSGRRGLRTVSCTVHTRGWTGCCRPPRCGWRWSQTRGARTGPPGSQHWAYAASFLGYK